VEPIRANSFGSNTDCFLAAGFSTLRYADRGFDGWLALTPEGSPFGRSQTVRSDRLRQPALWKVDVINSQQLFQVLGWRRSCACGIGDPWPAPKGRCSIQGAVPLTLDQSAHTYKPMYAPANSQIERLRSAPTCWVGRRFAQHVSEQAGVPRNQPNTRCRPARQSHPGGVRASWMKSPLVRMRLDRNY
jgi:hypothetical protein